MKGYVKALPSIIYSLVYHTIYKLTLDVVVFQDNREGLLLLVDFLANLVPRTVGEIYDLLRTVEVPPRFLQDISVTIHSQ